MRKAAAPFAALLTLLVTAAAVAGVTVTDIERQCLDDTESGQRFITGTVTVEIGSSTTGDMLILSLFGKIRGDESLLQTEPINLDEGTQQYDFTFENVPTVSSSSTVYQSYTITTDADNPEKSQSIDVELECRPGVIPEAPLVVLLIGSAGALSTWFVIRRIRAAPTAAPAA